MALKFNYLYTSKSHLNKSRIMKIFSLVAIILLFFGCNSKSEGTTSQVSDQEKDSQKITAKDIENLQFTDYVLSPDANEAVVTWQRYQELMVQMEFLRQGDFSFFGGKNELLLNFLKDLRNELPETVTTPSIRERLVVLETKILKFHSTLQLSNAKKKELLKNIQEILIATSNLHLQINKKFELESQIIQDPTKTQT